MTCQVNLLPAATRRRFEHRRLGRRWVMIWLLSAIALAATQYALYYLRNRSSHELDELQRSIQSLQQAEADTRRLASVAHTLRQYVDSCRVLEQADVPLGLLQAVSDSCHGTGTVQLESYRMDERTSGRGGADGGTVPVKEVRLAGIANSDVDIAALVSRLRSSNVFRQVDLEVSQANTDESNPRRSFQIRLQQ